MTPQHGGACAYGVPNRRCVTQHILFFSGKLVCYEKQIKGIIIPSSVATLVPASATDGDAAQRVDLLYA
jgi:hypothetical protein